MGQEREYDNLLDTDRLQSLNWTEESGDEQEWTAVTPNGNKRYLNVGQDDNVVNLYESHSTGMARLDELAVTKKSKFGNESALEWVTKNIIR